MKEQLPLDKRIEQAAKSYADQFKYGVEYREPAFVDGAAYCLEKLQAAEEKAAKYEKALKEIAAYSLTSEVKEIDLSDAEYGYNAIIETARESLTPKTGEDE